MAFLQHSSLSRTIWDWPCLLRGCLLACLPRGSRRFGKYGEERRNNLMCSTLWLIRQSVATVWLGRLLHGARRLVANWHDRGQSRWPPVAWSPDSVQSGGFKGGVFSLIKRKCHSLTSTLMETKYHFCCQKKIRQSREINFELWSQT